MKISRAGIELIKKFEGIRLDAYPDPGTGGEPFTIGYGITSAAGLGEIRKGMTITQAQADEWLVAALVKYEAAVLRHLKRVPSQAQFDAMTSLCFNIGESAFSKSTVVKKFNAGDIEGAANAFANWRMAGGKVMQGLVNRRAAERALFLAPSAKGEPPVLTDFETPTEKEPSVMNTNAIHNVLNVLGLIIGTLVTFDWAGLGFSAEAAAMIAGWVLMGDKIIKIAMNIMRDGIGGLFKVQPPVQK